MLSKYWRYQITAAQLSHIYRPIEEIQTHISLSGKIHYFSVRVLHSSLNATISSISELWFTAKRTDILYYNLYIYLLYLLYLVLADSILKLYLSSTLLYSVHKLYFYLLSSSGLWNYPYPVYYCTVYSV